MECYAKEYSKHEACASTCPKREACHQDMNLPEDKFWFLKNGEVVITGHATEQEITLVLAKMRRLRREQRQNSKEK